MDIEKYAVARTIPLDLSAETSEEALFQMVIFQALKDLMYNGPTAAGKAEVRRVKAWLFTQDFFDICDFANLEPTKIREKFLTIALERPGVRQKYLMNMLFRLGPKVGYIKSDIPIETLKEFELA